MQQCDDSWKQLEKNILHVGREVCGVTSGKRGKERETWWWNVNVQQKIVEKKMAFKRWQNSGLEEDKRIYKLASKAAKKEVAIAKQDAWANEFRNLNTAGGRNKMFRIAK